MLCCTAAFPVGIADKLPLLWVDLESLGQIEHPSWG
jgi:hypothetical protein